MRPKVRELSPDALFLSPIPLDYSEVSWEPVPPKGWPEERCAEELAPYMDYLYPLPPDFEERWRDVEGAARLVAEGTAMMLVRVEGVGYGLALRGAGMDFRWSIARAYVLLGYLPPVWLEGLPELAGMKYDAEARLVLNACLRALQVARRRLEHASRELRRLRRRVAARG